MAIKRVISKVYSIVFGVRCDLYCDNEYLEWFKALNEIKSYPII